MSTPVSIEAPAASRLRSDSEQERDLQARVQFMIDLQNEQQQLSDRGFEQGVSSSSQQAKVETGLPPLPNSSSNRTATDLRAMSTGDSLDDDQPFGAKSASTPYNSARYVASSLAPSQQGVGTGTLLFSNNYQRKFPTSGNSSNSIDDNSSSSNNNNGNNSLKPPFPGAGQQAMMPNVFHHDSTQQLQQQHAHLFGPGGYGTMANPPPPHQQHEFHYGNPDHNDPFDHDHPDGSSDPRRKRSSSRSTSFLASCCCICQPILDWLSLQHLQRSFCYGAIDGMLTGSGIISAFCGLNVLSATATWETRLAVVAFSSAACVADALCMAIGHIWTCYVVSSGHAAERVQGRNLLDYNKADAKGKLVDMLLAKGMLKIDAMSLADTLEGYPDLFVSTLVGDSLLGGGDDDDMHGADDDGGSSPVFYDGAMDDTRGVPRPLSGASGGSTGVFGSWRFPSYAHFNNEVDHDPEASIVNVVMQESQVEGLFMMISFATFATIPSLLWLILPQLVLGYQGHAHTTAALATTTTTSHYSHVSASETIAEAGDTISLPSLIVTVIAVIMWCLGVWKSRFLDSNWVMFGVESIVVLLICVMSAYAVGSALSYALLSGSGIDLAQVLQSST